MCYSSKMHIRNLFSLDDEIKAFNDGFLNVKEAYGFRVYNYSKIAPFHTESWNNPAVLNSRGLVVLDDGTVVGRPWKKFFNYGDPKVGEVDFQQEVEVTDKADGCLIILVPDASTPSGIRASTRGSMLAEHAEHAQHLLDTPNTLWDGYTPGDVYVTPGGVTPLFELITPKFKIIVDYGDTDNLVLLGGVDIESGDYLGPQAVASIIDWRGKLTEVMSYTSLQEALEAPPRNNCEGLVVRYSSNTLIKIKQSSYVLLHAALFNLTELTIWEAIRDQVPLAEVLAPLPDEVHEWVRSTYNWFIDQVNEEIEDANKELALIKTFLPANFTRKQLSTMVSESSSNSRVLFLLEDGKYQKAFTVILRTLRPAFGGDRPNLEQAR